MNAVLVADLGGSALKAALFRPDGQVLAKARVSLAFEEDQRGRSEQDPALWWRSLGDVVEALAHQMWASFPPVDAVAICGFTRTQIFLDTQGNALRPAIGFRDTRALGAAQEALANKLVAHYPGAAQLNAYHPLARLLWLKHNEPKVWAATRLVLEPKDYLNFQLTGRSATDRISQTWLASAFDGGATSLAAATGIDKDPLPRMMTPWDSVVEVHSGLPGALAHLAGARVLCGCNDTWTAVVGLGALRPDHAYCISGSSEVFGLIASENVRAEGLITLSWGDGLWQIGGPGQNGANVLDWVVNRLDRRSLPHAERLDSLLASPANHQPLVFHPFLHGERTPFWDIDLRGSFLGLTAHHSPGDLARAAMEGIGFVNRLVLERAEQAVASRAREVRIAGGGARNPHWNQIRADILDRPVIASMDAELGLRGGLALARFASGVDKDIANAADAVAPEFISFTPDPDRRTYLDELYNVFRDTQEMIAQASHRLAEIERRSRETVGVEARSS
jgi:xylulokinase